MTNGNSWLATAAQQLVNTAVAAAGIIITLVAMEFNGCTKQIDPPAPEPAKVVVADPESWLILDAQGVRTTDAALEKVAGALRPGKWTAQAIPKPGERGYTLSIVVDDGVKPKPEPPGPPEPPKPEPPKPPVVVPTTPTRATYVYEKDTTAVPSAVLAGLNRLNREKKILATLFEDDTTDGSGEVPEQYKVSLKAAKDAGLPALVIEAGDKVLRVVKEPKTAEAVVEAAQ